MFDDRYIVLFFDPRDYYGHASGNAPARPLVRGLTLAPPGA